MSAPGPEPLRLSLSESPHGASARVLAALAGELGNVHRYPPSDCEPVASQVAARWGLTVGRVLVGNGADELLLLAALALRARGSRAGHCARTFAGHGLSLGIAGYDATAVPLDERGLRLEVLEQAAAGSDVLYVCNPHNPTGSVLGPDEVARLVESAARSGCVLVLDESYQEFADPGLCGSAIPSLRAGAEVVVIRSLSKTHGLAGMRCGYLLAPEPVIATFARHEAALPFRVNRLALVAAQAALGDEDRLAETVAEVRAVRGLLTEELVRRGLDPLPSQTNFVLAGTRIPSPEFVGLLRSAHRIEVKDAASLGFDGRARIGVPLASDLPRLLAGIDDVLRRSER